MSEAKELSVLLKEYRQSHDCNNAAMFALEHDFPLSLYYSWESGRNHPSSGYARQLSKILGVHIVPTHEGLGKSDLTGIYGSICPSCLSDSSKVLESRLVTSNTDPLAGPVGLYRRRRECKCCQQRYTTYEVRSDSLESLLEGREKMSDEQAVQAVWAIAKSLLPSRMAPIVGETLSACLEGDFDE